MNVSLILTLILEANLSLVQQLKIGSHGIVEVLIPNPDLDF